MIRMSETTRTHTPGKQLDCNNLISSLMKHVLTNRPTFHSDSEKLSSKIWAHKIFLFWSNVTYWEVKFDMVCDMIFICPLLDFSIHVIGSTPLLLLHYLIEKTGDSTHRRTCRWGWGGLKHLPPPALPNFAQLRFLGQQEKFGQTKFLQKFPCFVSPFFLWKSYFLFWTLVGVVKPVKLISGLCVESNSEQRS